MYEVLWIVLQPVVGWAYGHVGEYAIHRWLLHGFLKKSPLFSFHLQDHHRECRANNMYDPSYETVGWNASTKEAVALFFLLAIHLPLYYVAPYFYAAIIFSVLSYYTHHYNSHSHPNWSRTELTWHYDHHMGSDQNANFGVRSGYIDVLLGTRKFYHGTFREQREWTKRSFVLVKSEE